MPRVQIHEEMEKRGFVKMSFEATFSISGDIPALTVWKDKDMEAEVSRWLRKKCDETGISVENSVLMRKKKL